jgi:pyoluteorin transport system permease protein
MVMAREWERGTLEALFATPARSDEILLGKTIPYFVLGMMGLGLCVLAAEFLFEVPLRGSVLVLTFVSMLYLLVTLGIGLLVSSTSRSQFIASQIALIASFLPAVMLSGFLFDIRSMPGAVRLITYIVPARYYVSILQSVFLAGDIWKIIVSDSLILTVFAAILLAVSLAATRKRLA